MNNNKNSNHHSMVLLLVATIVFAVGIVLIIWGSFSNKAEPGNVGALLALNFGGITFIGAAYTLISELLLKRDFARQLRASIDQRLEQTSLNDSIIKLGLNSVRENFELSHLWQRIEKANSVLSVTMRNSSFFRAYYDKILDRIIKEDAKFTFIMLDSNGKVISSVVKKFSGIDEDELRTSIQSTIDTFIKGYIFDKLPAEKKNNLIVRVFDEIPVYSAYLFDEEELWYIPFHFRHDYRPIPVFILKDSEQLKKSQLYEDLKELKSDALSNEVSFEKV